MSAKTNSRPPQTQVVGLDPVLLLPHFVDVMRKHAEAGTSSRLVYQDLAERLLSQTGEWPTGAGLESLVKEFNRTEQGSHLPVGTAGTASEVIKAFRSSAAAGIQNRLPLLSLPDSVREDVARLFDSIVDHLRQSVSSQYQLELEAAHARHEQAMSQLRTNMQTAMETQVGLLRQSIQEAEVREAGLETELVASNNALRTSQEKLSDCTSRLDDLARRLQVESGDLVIARKNQVQLEATLESAQRERDRSYERENENRKQVLKLTDDLRQSQQAAERHKASAAHLGADLQSQKELNERLASRVEILVASEAELRSGLTYLQSEVEALKNTKTAAKSVRRKPLSDAGKKSK